MMKNIFDENVYEDLQKRINTLSNISSRLWGRMEVAQMLHHVQMPLNIMLGKNHYNLKSNFIAKMLFKKSLYSDKLWAKNLPTVPPFKVTEQKDFKTEKTALLELLQEAHQLKSAKKIDPHPIFGEFTKEEWGKLQYKHLDHHLRQFGA